jgi:hypothetical protein
MSADLLAQVSPSIRTFAQSVFPEPDSETEKQEVSITDFIVTAAKSNHVVDESLLIVGEIG